MSNITVREAKFLCLIRAEREAPVRNVTTRAVRVEKVSGTPVTTENVEGSMQG